MSIVFVSEHMGLIEEGSWDEAGLWNASDQQEPEEEVGLRPDWQRLGRPGQDFAGTRSKTVTLPMGDVGGGFQASPAPQLAASADAVPDGGVPCSQFSGTGAKYESEGGALEVRGSGDAAELAASCRPTLYSSEKARDLRTLDAHVQVTQDSVTCHAEVVSAPMKAGDIPEGGQACDDSPPYPPACEDPEAQEGVFGTRQPSGVVDDGPPALRLCSSFPTLPSLVHCQPDGDVSVTQASAPFPVVPPPSEFQVDYGEGPTLRRADAVEEVSRFSNVSIEEGNVSTSWLQAPQLRGKALVRRGRPRPWSAESREETHKRVKIDELYGGASQSVELTVFNSPPPAESPFSQERSQKLANADAVHDATVLKPSLQARMNVATDASAAAEKEQSLIPVTITEPFVDHNVEIPVKVAERSPIVTRCGGITLNGNQCTHNVKDGSGFCVKHTKVDVEHSKRTDVEGSGASSRGVPYYKQPDAIVFRCRGKTLNGNQCTHNVKDGGVYCLKHGDQAWGPPSRRIEERVSYQTYPPTIQHELPVQIQNHLYVQVPVQVPVHEQAPIIAPPFPEEEDDGAGVARCIGRTRRTEEQCSFRPKSGSVFCERHARQNREKGGRDYSTNCEAPSSSSPTTSLSASLSFRKRQALNVTDMSCGGTRERRSVSKAKDLFTDILNAGLLRGKVVSLDGKDLVGWICEEVTRDTLSGEALLALLAEEKERLRKVLIEDRKSLAIVKPPDFWRTKYSPNLARTYSEITDYQTVCEKGNQNDALHIQSSGRFSSNADGASETTPFFAQMTRQDSEFDRDILACALCTKRFAEMPSLGKHWKENHKKEAFLFQKGMACCECGQEYTSKGGLLRHWKSTHPTLPISDFNFIVCMMCDAKLKDFNLLWMHVEEQHYLAFSSADFAQHIRKGVLGGVHSIKCSTCEEEFDTQLEFYNHNESVHNGLSPADVYAVGDSPIAGPSCSRFTTHGNEASPGRFKCRFCGLRFILLPDLGRHHQAVHGTKSKNKLSINVGCVEGKFPPSVKRTPLPNPETACSPPGKVLPLAELFTSRSSVRNTEEREHQSSVEWPHQTPVPALQSPALNFRHLKTIARERRKAEENIVDASPVPSPAPPFAPPPAPVIAPKKRGRQPKSMQSLQNDKLPMKKRRGRPAKKIVEHMKAVQQSQQGRHGFNGHLPEDGVQAVSKMPLQRAASTNGFPAIAETIVNTTGWPTSAELLAAALVACCKDSWYRELAKKHKNIHPNIHLQAVSLFAVMRPDIQWLANSFLCPNQCRPFDVMEAAGPQLEVDMAGFSEAAFKAQADHAADIKDVTKGKRLVVNEDLSGGQEPAPIPCVIDEEVFSRPCPCASCRENGGNSGLEITEPWKRFCYINKRLLDPSLGLDTESSKLGCACGEGKCSPSHCDHVLMFDNDNDHACDKSGVAMKGRFPYDEQGRIILEEGYMVYECNSSCTCWEDCQNRVLQRGVRVKLEVFKTRHKGWAVRAAEPIRSGTFVCEYIGEVVADREANLRGVGYDKQGCSYLYDIDAHLDLVVSRAGQKPFVIDATNHGNVARFINHSCGPNLVNYEVLVESMDCQLAHIGFFARRDIAAGEELAYDYRYKLLPGKGTACHCGASSCRGRLY